MFTNPNIIPSCASSQDSFLCVSCSFCCRFEAVMLVFGIPHQNITWHLKGIYYILHGCNKTQWEVLRNDILPICFWLLTHGMAMLKCRVILDWPLPEVQSPRHKSLLLLYFTTLLEKGSWGICSAEFLKWYEISRCQGQAWPRQVVSILLNIVIVNMHNVFQASWEGFLQMEDIILIQRTLKHYREEPWLVYLKNQINSHFSMWMFWQFRFLSPAWNWTMDQNRKDEFISVVPEQLLRVQVHLDSSYCSTSTLISI